MERISADNRGHETTPSCTRASANGGLLSRMGCVSLLASSVHVVLAGRLGVPADGCLPEDVRGGPEASPGGRLIAIGAWALAPKLGGPLVAQEARSGYCFAALTA